MTTKNKVQCTVKELVQKFFEKLPTFLKHVHLTTHQHNAFRNLKANLDFNEVIFAFDFSTNYLGKCREEIQSSNYGASKQQISLQTGIFYYRDKNSNLIKHASFGTVCDFLQHDAAAAWASLEPAFEYLLELVPDVEIIHSISDGPTSQYRNKRFLYLYKYFCQKLKLKKATQNYSAPGHGKGGPDAEGAIIKGNCDRAVLRGIDVMCAQDVIDVNQANPEFKIKVFKIAKEDVERMEKIIPEKLPPVAKILSAYQVTWLKSQPEILNLKSMTCDTCNSTTSFCEHYNIYNFNYAKKTVENKTKTKEKQALLQTGTFDDEKYNIGEWIVVRYDGQWYPGVIKKTKKALLVTKFMDGSNNNFFWPKNDDIQDVYFEQVLCKIRPPKKVKNGKNVVLYQLDQDEYDNVDLMSNSCPIYEV